MDRTPVTTKFDYTTPPLQIDQTGPSHLSPADWKRTRLLLEELVKERSDELERKLEALIYQATT